jgi:hypothetical protein
MFGRLRVRPGATPRRLNGEYRPAVCQPRRERGVPAKEVLSEGVGAGCQRFWIRFITVPYVKRHTSFGAGLLRFPQARRQAV